MKDFTISTKVKVYRMADAIGEIKELIDRAKSATATSYSPYSGYAVGAAVLLDDGNIVAGSNQENAAYPSGLCAERTALFYANASAPHSSVKAIAIIAYYQDDFVKDVCTPCGSCRQVLAEVENRYGRSIKVIMCSRDTIYEIASVKELLPLSFGSDALK